MTDSSIFPVPTAWADRAFADNEKYQEMYAQSIQNPDAFWEKRANASIG